MSKFAAHKANAVGLSIVSLLLVHGGCASGTSDDGLSEGGANGSLDGAVNGTTDGGTNAVVDSAANAKADSGTNAAVDSAANAKLDSGTNAAVDSATAAKLDSGTNAAIDTALPGKMDSAPAVSLELSCLSILDCIYACKDPDGPCPDQCVTDGSRDGVAKITTLAECIQAESCTDADCLTNKCGTALKGCIDSSAPKIVGTPPTGTAPKGSIPAELIGVWSVTEYGDTERLTFKADGTGIHFAGVSTISYGRCLSLTSTAISGPMVVTGDKITLYGDSVDHLSRTCSDPGPITSKGNPTVEVIPWFPNNATSIYIIGASCAAAHAGEPASSIQGYCRVKLTKE